MSTNAKEFLWVVQEGALNTPVASPVTWPTPSPNAFYIRLVDGNSFSMMATPIIEEIPYGGGFAVTADAVSDHYQCKGQLKTKLYSSQAAMLLGLLMTRVDGSGNPWASTEPVGDLASCSIYHAIRRSDGTYKRTQFSGVKAAGGTIEVSRQSTTAMLTLDLLACKSAGNAMDGSSDPSSGAFPAPVEDNYPLSPYTFHQTAGGFFCRSSGSAVRMQYDSLAIKIQSALDGRWFEQSYLTVNQFCGRASTLEADLYLQATPDDQSAFEALTAQTVGLTFTTGVTGTNLTLMFNGQNTITQLPYDLPLNQAFMRKLSLKNRFDPTAGGDISFSLA